LGFFVVVFVAEGGSGTWGEAHFFVAVFGFDFAGFDFTGRSPEFIFLCWFIT